MFYLAVHDQLRHSAQDGQPAQSLEIPGLQLELSAEVIWATGPVVLVVLLLAYLGSLRAYPAASDVLRLGAPDRPHEAFDTAPNAIDLALYSVAWNPWYITVPLYFVIPTVVSAVLFEVLWLTHEIAVWPQAIVGQRFWLWSSLGLSLPALCLIVDVWSARLRRVSEQFPTG